MTNKVFCRRFKKELPGLETPPFPGAAGEEIFSTVSQRAWQEWQNLQTMLINENQLDLSNKENRKWLNDQMERYLNNADYQKPSGYIPE